MAAGSTTLILAPTKSRIYAVLPVLLADGLVARRKVEQYDRPDKQLYRLTAAGRRALKAWLDDTSRPLFRDELLLKLFFGYAADGDALLEQLAEYRAALDDERAHLEAIDSAHRAHGSGHDAFRNLTVRAGLAMNRALTRWSDETKRRLELGA